MKKLITNEVGQALVTVALVMAVLMGLAALTVDLGMVHLARVKMQNAADAAALAGAGDLVRGAGNPVQTAQTYGALNGAGTTDVNAPYNGDRDAIEVFCTKNVPYMFARVLGFTDADVTARAVAAAGGMAEAFNFALFSGHPHYQLSLSGFGMHVYGHVHSNNVVSMNMSDLTVDGVVQSVGAMTIGGVNVTITGGRKPYVDPIDMPDFADTIRAEAEAAGRAYSGDKVFSGNGINVDEPIYVDGNLKIQGANFTGAGVVLASGDIELDGTNVTSFGGASTCFYSANGNIKITGANISLNGLVFAPKGNIEVSADTVNVNGRVIGNYIAFSGRHFNIISGEEELKSLPKLGVKLVE